MSIYVSEISYSDEKEDDFIEVRVPAGTDTTGWTIAVYQSDGTVDTTMNFGSSVSTGGGGDIYLFDETTGNFNNILSNQAIAIVDDTGTVQQFISFSGNTVTAIAGPANGQTSTEIGTASGEGTSLESTDGTNYSLQNTPNPGTVPCFAPGTMIETPGGPRPVELLRPGDLVCTLDRGARPVVWTHAAEQSLVEEPEDRAPVLVRAGGLGPGRPAADLVISPQHRVLVGGAGQLGGRFGRPVLVPAKALACLPRIRRMNGRRAALWHHFACARHEIVRANGAWVESLLLGPMVLAGLPRRERHRLCAQLGGGCESGCPNGPPARDCLGVGAARRQLEGRAQPA